MRLLMFVLCCSDLFRHSSNSMGSARDNKRAAAHHAAAAPPVVWVRFTSADGRFFWFNQVTDQSTWIQPAAPYRGATVVEQNQYYAMLPAGEARVWRSYGVMGGGYWYPSVFMLYFENTCEEHVIFTL